MSKIETCQVEDLVGLPYRRGARLPGPSVDCFGLVLEVFRRRGIALPDPYDSVEHPLDARQWILERLEGWVRRDQPVAGGVVEFRGRDAPAHLGYLLNEREFLHSTKRTGAIVSRLDREPWASTVVGFYEYGG